MSNVTEYKSLFKALVSCNARARLLDDKDINDWLVLCEEKALNQFKKLAIVEMRQILEERRRLSPSPSKRK